MAAKTRDGMVLSAVQLFRRDGYNGTGLRDVIAHSGAPRGSIYRDFPEGEAQLGVEAVTFAGDVANAAMARALQSADLVAGIEKFWARWTRFVEASNFEEGCPIVGVAAEAHPEAPELPAAAAAVFDRWEATFASAFRTRGLTSAKEAGDLAAMIVATLEGATIMSRAAQSTQPLVRAGRQLGRALRVAMPS